MAHIIYYALEVKMLKVVVDDFVALLRFLYNCLQLAASFDHVTWYARSSAFYSSPLIINLVWARIIGDLVFIAGAALLFWEVARMMGKLRQSTNVKEQDSITDATV